MPQTLTLLNQRKCILVNWEATTDASDNPQFVMVSQLRRRHRSSMQVDAPRGVDEP